MRGEGAARWEEAGRPTVPSLALGDRVVPLFHVSQLARALGLPSPTPPASARMAWETVGRLHRWVERLRPLGRETESRGRTLINLTINVFHPFELLPVAWERGRFDWDPTLDDERERALESPEAVVAFAVNVEREWADFVAEHEDELESRDPVISSLRGELRYSELLESQVWHAEFHQRQLEAFLS